MSSAAEEPIWTSSLPRGYDRRGGPVNRAPLTDSAESVVIPERGIRLSHGSGFRERVLALQRSAGNRAVGRVLARQPTPEELLKLDAPGRLLELQGIVTKWKGAVKQARIEAAAQAEKAEKETEKKAPPPRRKKASEKEAPEEEEKKEKPVPSPEQYAHRLSRYFLEEPHEFAVLESDASLATFLWQFLPEREKRLLYDAFGSDYENTTNVPLKKLLNQGRLSGERIGKFHELISFAAEFGYAHSEQPYKHEIFGNQTLTLYPIERKAIQTKDRKKRDEVHRPILDLELFGGQWCARCYLALFAKAAPGSEYKDITADRTGAITLRKLRLMNLGNPYKALLWIEDYLLSSEHDANRPDPVLRTWLIPLSDARWMLSAEEARPLDRDRGSGQFGQYGSSGYVYSEKLHPIPGSLVSFFVNPDELKADEPGQVKLPISLLQHFLTGAGGDPRDMTTEGIAAQHGRQEHQAKFSEQHGESLTSYYLSLEETGYTPATADEAPKRGKYAKERSGIANTPLDAFEYFKAEKNRPPRSQHQPNVRH
jgi:hypothetical protein